MSRSLGSAAAPLRVILACCTGLLLPMLMPLATGRVFTKDDLGALHLPFRHLYREALHAGQFLLWTPAYHAGFFIHGAGEVAMAHPVHLALYRFLPLGPAFNLEIIGAYLFLFGGSILLLKRLRLSTEAAVFGAMTITFSGFMLFNMMHMNHIATFAHAPWLLAAAHWVVTSDNARSRGWAVAAVALVTGSQLLSGNPQYVWLTSVAVGYMAVMLLVSGCRPARLAVVGLGMLAGGLLGAVQLLPTLEFFEASTRAGWALDQSLTFSLHPLNVMQLWAPFALQYRVFAPPAEEFIIHEFVVYNGAFCTLALAWVAIRWKHLAHQRLLMALLGFAALALVLAFGRHGWLYQWIAQLPGLRGLRAPSRHILLFQLALSGIAAIAFEDLVALVRRRETIDLRRLWPLAVPVTLTIVTTTAAALLAGSPWADAHGIRFSSLWRAAPWSMFVLVQAFLLVLASRGVARALPMMIAVAALDLGAWGYSYAYRWGPIQSIASLTAQAQVPPEAKPGDVIPPVAGGRDYLALFRGLRLTWGYTGLYPASMLDPADPIAQRLAGITWRGDGDRWEPVTDALPRARLVAAAVVSADTKRDLAGIDVARVVLSESALELSGDPGSVRLMTDRPGWIELETTSAEGRQLLVLTERFHPGWRATVDGRAQPPARAYGDFLGLVIEPGTHRVIFDFAPGSVRAGLSMTAAGVVLTALLGWVVGRTRKPDYT